MAQQPTLDARPVTGPLGEALACSGRVRSDQIPELSDDGLEASLEILDALRQEIDRITVAVVADAARRDTATSTGASSLADWVRQHAPGMAPSELGQLVTVVRAARIPRNEPLADAVLAGEVPIRRAARVAHALEQIRPFVEEADYDAYQAFVLPLARTTVGGNTDKKLTHACTQLVGVVSPVRDTEDQAARQRRARDFFERPTAGGMTDFTWRLDPEGAALVRAVTMSSAARPCPDESGPDPRTAGHRRADALLTVLKRGMADSGAIQTSGAVTMVVGMNLDMLAAGAKEQGLGETQTGEHLTPGQLRRLACEAGIVPAVYGTASQPLDLGRTVRLASAAQHLALAIRDRGCTFPGCTMPPQWCVAHHVRWWSRGGATDLANLALLCGHHHTVVHASDRGARVSDDGVVWDP